mmetsp:Transcript_77978/g.215634  ORF Transcript_77978/g.215634 Transcript_77978/m.215634 type:complete len:267 (-) Transcript_77978:1423-2223(-)
MRNNAGPKPLIEICPVAGQCLNCQRSLPLRGLRYRGSGARRPQPHQPLGARGRAEDRAGLVLQLLYNAGVQQRRGVAQVGGVVLRDLAQDAAHDLAASRLRQRAGEDDVVRLRKGPDLLAHTLLELRLQIVVALVPLLQDHVAEEPRTLDLMWVADHCRLRGPRMSNQGMLDLRAADAVAGDIDDVIHAAGDPIVPVLVADATVAGEVEAWVGPKVGVQHPLVIPIDCAEHRGPRLGENQNTRYVVALKLLACGGVQHAWVHSEHG